jgi:murein hydrolase activator
MTGANRIVRAALLIACGIALLVNVSASLAQTTTPTKSHKTPATKTKKKIKAATTANAGTRPRAIVAPVDLSNPREAQAQQSGERDRLTTRIAELKKQIAAGEKSRTGTAAALARAERSLRDVNRRLDELAQRQRESQERVAGLDRQRAGTESRIAARAADFARTAKRLDANRDRDPLTIFLSGGDADEPMMTRAYLGYTARAQATDLASLRGRAQDLQAQRQRADEDNRVIAAQAEAQKSARDTLAADQAAQKQSLAQLSQKIAEQRDAAAALEADEKRLTRVVEQLQRVIDRQAAEERARREAAKRLADQQAAKKKGGKSGDTTTKPREDTTPPARVDAVPDPASGSGAFVQLRGQLRLPVRGSITGRFGAPRGSGGATWKGVFVKTESGADVRAVAAGKVVFADDLRGFGNLLIIDHGDQYLSIYGNNESLLKHTGDSVKPGDVVSHAGNSSGDDQTGLYFELRFQGRPFDPMSWTGAR